ncbi:MAG: hypothetical protein ACR2OC_09655 [Solirubrobacterales bacterium]
MLWTVALAVTVAIVAFTGGCGDVRPADFHVCELGRDSTISGLAMLWFIGVVPAAVFLLLARGRRERCRICGDELGSRERRICRACGTHLVDSANRSI